jgi:hypothetical protein
MPFRWERPVRSSLLRRRIGTEGERVCEAPHRAFDAVPTIRRTINRTEQPLAECDADQLIAGGLYIELVIQVV